MLLSKAVEELNAIMQNIENDTDKYRQLLDFCSENKIAIWHLNTSMMGEARFYAFNPNAENSHPSMKGILKKENSDQLFVDSAMKLKCPLIFAQSGIFKPWQLSLFNFEV